MIKTNIVFAIHYILIEFKSRSLIKHKMFQSIKTQKNIRNSFDYYKLWLL